MRSLALKSACKIADGEKALEIIEMFTSWTTDLGFSKWSDAPQEVRTELYAKRRLTREFVTEHLPRIAPLMGDQQTLLELLETLVTQRAYAADLGVARSSRS